MEEYITNVDSVPCIVNVPKFPIPKESNLNFLKPGSKEVVTRPVHIHEHLPPIQPHEGKIEQSIDFFPLIFRFMRELMFDIELLLFYFRNTSR